MNKYGVILVGGTIGSVFAGGNCSGKENEKKNKIDEFKAELKEYFSVDNDKIYIIKEGTDPNNITKREKNKINGIRYIIIGSKDCFAYVEYKSVKRDNSKLIYLVDKNDCDFYETHSWDDKKVYTKKFILPKGNILHLE